MFFGKLKLKLKLNLPAQAYIISLHIINVQPNWQYSMQTCIFGLPQPPAQGNLVSFYITNRHKLATTYKKNTQAVT